MGDVYAYNDSEGYTIMSYLLDKFLDIMFWLAAAVVSLLPDYIWSHGDAVNLLASAISTVNQYFPVTDLFEIIVIYVAYYGMVTWVRPLLKFVRLA